MDKYLFIKCQHIELIYLGIDKRDQTHIFIFNSSDNLEHYINNNNHYIDNFYEDLYELWGFSYEKIKLIKNKYNMSFYKKCYFRDSELINLKPNLKNKIKNILNR